MACIPQDLSEDVWKCKYISSRCTRLSLHRDWFCIIAGEILAQVHWTQHWPHGLLFIWRGACRRGGRRVLAAHTLLPHWQAQIRLYECLTVIQCRVVNNVTFHAKFTCFYNVRCTNRVSDRLSNAKTMRKRFCDLKLRWIKSVVHCTSLLEGRPLV